MRGAVSVAVAVAVAVAVLVVHRVAVPAVCRAWFGGCGSFIVRLHGNGGAPRFTRVWQYECWQLGLRCGVWRGLLAP